jgi:hypothetical protein
LFVRHGPKGDGGKLSSVRLTSTPLSTSRRIFGFSRAFASLALA